MKVMINCALVKTIFLFVSIHVHLAVLNKKPPPDLVQQYTMGGEIPIEYYLVDDTYGGVGSHYKFSADDFDNYVNNAKKAMESAPTRWKLFQTDCAQDIRVLPNVCYRLLKQYGLYFALLNNSQTIFGSKSIIFGSMEPWVEALLYSLGAGNVVTLEYNPLTYNTSNIYPSLLTISQPFFHTFYTSHHNAFHVAFSISSFDHDGLGRYGDPLSADADLEAMRRVRETLQPGGMLFLTVPVGSDIVVYNLHRRYGAVRLPLLLQGWEVLERIGWNELQLDRTDISFTLTYEPVFVLRKPLDEAESSHVASLTEL